MSEPECGQRMTGNAAQKEHKPFYSYSLIWVLLLRRSCLQTVQIHQIDRRRRRWIVSNKNNMHRIYNGLMLNRIFIYFRCTNGAWIIYLLWEHLLNKLFWMSNSIHRYPIESGYIQIESCGDCVRATLLLRMAISQYLWLCDSGRNCQVITVRFYWCRILCIACGHLPLIRCLVGSFAVIMLTKPFCGRKWRKLTSAISWLHVSGCDPSGK